MQTGTAKAIRDKIIDIYDLDFSTEAIRYNLIGLADEGKVRVRPSCQFSATYYDWVGDDMAPSFNPQDKPLEYERRKIIRSVGDVPPELCEHSLHALVEQLMRAKR